MNKNNRNTYKHFSILLAGLLSFFVSINSQAQIAQNPLFLVSSVNPNVLFNMSVETPMGGAAYNDQPDGASCGGRVNDGGTVGVCYDRTQTYLGYFDPDKCYNYSASKTRFNPSSDTINSFHECSGKFSGNMLNWATMTAMDMFVWTMTGGNRVDDGADNTTVIRRVRKQNNDGWFPHKLLSSSRNVAPSTVTPWSDSKIYIYNTDFGVRFGTSRGSDNKSGGTYDVEIRVCNINRTLEDNCVPYNSGAYYKPEGLIQKNADSMRFAVTSYSNTNGNGIDGGVLRSNMKYVGTTMPDGSGNTITNTLAEINSDGTFNTNPNPSDASASGVSYSGVITYLNKFSDAGYKGNDPASELFYESIRYFKNLGPTSEYLSGNNGGFPIIGSSAWEDPIQYSCQKNFIVGMNDANPWKDKKLPGTFFTSSTFNGESISDDYGQPSSPDSAINVTTLTNKVGQLEGLNGTTQHIGCTIVSCDNNSWNKKNIPGLGEVFGTHPYAPKENSYYIAGLAYYANTQDIRTGQGGTTDFEGDQTISTFMIDSQEYSSSPLIGPMNMLWLAGKYGGFLDENGDNDPNNGSTPSHASPAVSSGSTSTDEWDADGDNEPDNYVLATEPKKLVDALNSAFDNIVTRTTSATSVATNSTRLDTNSKIYQARFNSADWSGQLLAYDLNESDGSIGTLEWNAADFIPAEASRKVYSYKYPDDSSSPTGIEFEYTNLNQANKDALDKNASSVVDSLGSQRVDYIRGDQSNELQNGGTFRDRTSLLGDVINSDPWFLGRVEDFGYSVLSGTEGSSYITHRNSKLSKTPSLYFGSNDGLFHAINAETGAELFTYVPNAIIPNLNKLTSSLYGCDSNGCIDHQYFVDGPSKAGDAYIDIGNGDEWRTVIVGTLGAGGKGLFAIDVTDPVPGLSGFSSTNILWDISTTNAPTSADLADSSNKPGFTNNLGYTFGQPSIVRMQNGQWVAIVANGFESASDSAVIFIIDIETGSIIKSFDTEVGDAATPNGMATPIAIDSDGDRSTDVIYAGDLQGNLWKLDVSSSSENSWDFAFKQGGKPSPLFNAIDSTGNAQPITSKPQVGEHPDGGLMVYFGTGKYYEVGDDVVGSSPQIQTFYGIRDQNQTIAAVDHVNDSASSLQKQSIIFEAHNFNGSDLDIRVTSDTKVNYTNKKGWYLNLESPLNGVEGERVVSPPLLRAGRVIFVTLIPESDPCSWGGTSWLMEMDAINGARLDQSPIDIDGDGKIDEADMIAYYDSNGDGVIDDSDTQVGISGVRKQDIGIMKTPGVVSADNNTEIKYVSGSSGSLDLFKESSGDPSGRQSWRQLK